MTTQVTLTLNTPIGSNVGPNLTLTADVGVVIPSTVTVSQLLTGFNVSVDTLATQVTATSSGICSTEIVFEIPSISVEKKANLYSYDNAGHVIAHTERTVPPFNYTPYTYLIPSFTINAIEFITGTPPSITLTPSNLNLLPAPNLSGGQIITNFVDFLNATFTSLGLTDYTAQLSYNAAPTAIPGYLEDMITFYIIYPATDVFSISVSSPEGFSYATSLVYSNNSFIRNYIGGATPTMSGPYDSDINNSYGPQMVFLENVCPIIGNQVDDNNMAWPCISTVTITNYNSPVSAGFVITKFEMVSNNYGVVYTSTSSISGDVTVTFDNTTNPAFVVGDVITVTYEIVGYVQPPGTTGTDLCMDAINITDGIGLFPGGSSTECVIGCNTNCLGSILPIITFTVEPGKNYDFYPNLASY